MNAVGCSLVGQVEGVLVCACVCVCMCVCVFCVCGMTHSWHFVERLPNGGSHRRVSPIQIGTENECCGGLKPHKTAGPSMGALEHSERRSVFRSIFLSCIHISI